MKEKCLCSLHRGQVLVISYDTNSMHVSKLAKSLRSVISYNMLNQFFPNENVKE